MAKESIAIISRLESELLFCNWQLTIIDKNKNNIMSEYKLKKTKMEDKVVGAYKKIEDGVVNTYKTIEDGVVNTYKNIEDKFVEKFLDKEE